jgi:branched-chain amino acid transport system ATP-binding protein
MNEDSGLIVDGVTASYGEVIALRSVNIAVPELAARSLLGANGAGKSTLLRCISGQLPPRDGKVYFDGRDITGLRPDEILKLGIAHVLEGRQVFAQMSVRENLELGATARGHSMYKESMEILYGRFPILKEKAHQAAGTLSGGQQQMLAICRAFMSRPRLLLLDEPSLGLAPVMLPVVAELIKWAQQTLNAAVLIVEQYTTLALSLSSFGYVLKNGRVVASGTSSELESSDVVRSAYLGQNEPKGAQPGG